jgi:hypothetical protein
VRKQLFVAVFAAVVLLSGLSACGGSDDKADPKPAASATPTTPVQPKGELGVTYDIQNWDTYADDPAVLAYKKTNEAVSASGNARRVLPAMREGLSRPLLRQYVATLNTVWKHRWHFLEEGSATVRSASSTSSRARLVMCEWKPSFAFYVAA